MSDDLDLGALDTLDEVLGGADETRVLLGEFRESASKWTRAILAETRPGAATEGHRAAHTLATSATTVGARALGRAAREIEIALARGVVPGEDARGEVMRLFELALDAWARAGRLR